MDADHVRLGKAVAERATSVVRWSKPRKAECTAIHIHGSGFDRDDGRGAFCSPDSNPAGPKAAYHRVSVYSPPPVPLIRTSARSYETPTSEMRYGNVTMGDGMMRNKHILAAMAVLTAGSAVAAPASAYDHYHHSYHGRGGHYHRCGGGNGAVGTIAGGVGGAVIGSAVGGGALGTVAGGVGGALLGRHLDKVHTRHRRGC